MKFFTTRIAAPALLALAATLAFQPIRALAQDKVGPDTLIFTNGDQLHGILVSGTGDSVVFKSDAVGDLTIPVAKIKELRSHNAFVVLPKEVPDHPGPVPTGNLAFGDGKVAVESSSSSAVVEVPPAQVGYVVDQAEYQKAIHAHPGFLHGWGGAVSGGASVVQSTQYGQTYNVGVGLVRSIPVAPYLRVRNRTLFDLSETYGKLSQKTTPQTVPPTPDTTVKTNIFHADAEHDIYLTKKLYVLGMLAYDHNFSQGMDLQQIYGGGAGYTVFSTPVQQLDLKATVQYEKQHYIDPVQPLPPLPQIAPTADQNLIGSTFGENYRRILPYKVALTQFLTLIPSWNNTNAYSANAGVALALPVYKRLAVNLSLLDNFINNPANGFQKNSFQFITGVSYTVK